MYCLWLFAVSKGCLSIILQAKWKTNGKEIKHRGDLRAPRPCGRNGNIEQQSDNGDGITWMRIQNVMSLYTKRGENQNRREKWSFLLVLYMISHVVADELGRGDDERGNSFAKSKPRESSSNDLFLREILIRGCTCWESHEWRYFCKKLKFIS